MIKEIYRGSGMTELICIEGGKMTTKTYIKLMSRILAMYLMILPISMIGIERPQKGVIAAGVVSAMYLIICCVADRNREEASD